MSFEGVPEENEEDVNETRDEAFSKTIEGEEIEEMLAKDGEKIVDLTGERNEEIEIETRDGILDAHDVLLERKRSLGMIKEKFESFSNPVQRSLKNTVLSII